VNGINLIPAHRLITRRRAARVRVWLCIAPVCVSMLAGSYAWLWGTWETRTSDVKERMSALDTKIAATEHETTDLKAATKEAQAALQAARAVADQPDWGLVLSMIASRLDEDVVLSACQLEPTDAPATSGATAQPGVPVAKASAPAASSGRPTHYRLILAGLAKTQDAASRLAVELTEAHLFDAVTPQEARRSTFLGEPVVAFRIECLVADAAGGRP
jgi:hypothetical protein